MWLKNAFNRFLVLLKKRSRKNYDFTWLVEAQKKYPEAFEKTSEFIASLEGDSHKIFIESGKPVTLSAGGVFWFVIMGIFTWVIQHLNDPPVPALIKTTAFCQGMILSLSGGFVVFEFMKFFYIKTKDINEIILEQIENIWIEILHNNVSKDIATEIIDLNISKLRFKTIIHLSSNSYNNNLFNKLFFCGQFFLVAFVSVLGFLLLEARIRTFAASQKEQNSHSTIIIQTPSLNPWKYDQNSHTP